MAISAITDEFALDMTITRARYAELIIAEEEASKLKNLLKQAAERGEIIGYRELALLCEVFNIEVEGRKNGADF